MACPIITVRSLCLGWDGTLFDNPVLVLRHASFTHKEYRNAIRKCYLATRQPCASAPLR
jgi:hypothetical protein